MEYVNKPPGVSRESIRELEGAFGVSLPSEFYDWWQKSNGADIFFGFKELQFFSIIEILGEDIYELKKYMPNSIPVCMDGNGNICVAKIVQERISGYYIANCGDLGWDEAKFVAKSLVELINDQVSPENRLNT